MYGKGNCNFADMLTCIGENLIEVVFLYFARTTQHAAIQYWVSGAEEELY